MRVASTGSLFAEAERHAAREQQEDARVARAHVVAGLFESSARARIGRYELHSRIGEGAHGRVMRAFDPRLRRRVAIKILRAPIEATEGRTRAARAAAEARGLARLQHPGVVGVYDVGVHLDASGAATTFIVMELVDGADLHAWIADRSRHFRDVLRVGTSAAQGLAAAHRAGLVHRDVKPSNVLVSADGTGKVADFGLVALAGHARTTARGTDTAERDLPDRLTETGRLLGTPLYMAPEQHAAAHVDARADQYAFCVTMWEALFGAPPFRGASVLALHEAKLLGPPRPPRFASSGRVPEAVVRALARGLAVDPADRHADMDALVRALHAAARPGRRRAAAVALATLATGGLALVAIGPADARPCTTPRSPGADEPEAIAAAFEASGRLDASERSARVLDELAGWQARFDDASDAECRATPRSSLAGACLGHAWEERTALVSTLATADARVVGRAVTAVAELPDPARCLDPAAQPEAERAPEVAAALARAQALQAAGREHEAWRLATSILRDLRVGDPAWIDAAFRVGRLELLAEEGSAAATLERVHHEATVRGEPVIAAAAGAQLLQLFTRRDDLAAAGAWDRHTEAALRRAGDPDDVRLVWLHGRAMLAQRSGRPGDAVAAYDEAARLAERLGATEQAATSIGMRGLARRDLGDLDGARADLKEALRLREDAIGSDDPRLCSTLQNLASALVAAGAHEEATRVLTRARALALRHHGTHDPRLVAIDELLGLAAYEAGDLPRAHALLAAVVDARAQDPEAGLRSRAHASYNLGNVAALRGDAEAAAQHHTRALSWLEEAVGPEHPQVAYVLAALADAQREQGRIATALASLRRAEALLVRGDVPPVRRAELWSILANTLVADGRPEEARVSAERAIAVFDEAGLTERADDLRALIKEERAG